MASHSGTKARNTVLRRAGSEISCSKSRAETRLIVPPSKLNLFLIPRNRLSFEGGTINRVSALDLLHEISDPARRKTVFLAFVPLWEAINGNDERDSPYRRMIAGAVAEAALNGSEIDHVAGDAGIDTGEVERWLVRILEAWRESSGDAMVEPWGLSLPDRRSRSAARLLRPTPVPAAYQPALLQRTRC